MEPVSKSIEKTLHDQILTFEEVTELLSTSPKTLRGYIRSGELVSRRFGGQWRILESDLMAFMRSLPTNQDK